jgi:hypothetical protein
MPDPKPDERLAQFNIAALSPFPFDHPATQIVQDAFAELVAEATRARCEEKRLRALIADEVSVIGQGFERDEEFEAMAGENERLRKENREMDGRLAAMRDLLGSIWLYVNWRYVTKQLTTEQKELWADVVDADVMATRAADGEVPRGVADRWWREDA